LIFGNPPKNHGSQCWKTALDRISLCCASSVNI